MKKIKAFFISLLFSLSLISCSGETPSAHVLLSEFKSTVGASGIVYSKEVCEGESGYIDGNFFVSLYGTEADFESDFAVLLNSTLDTVYEAAVFVAFDKSSLYFAKDLCRGRLDFLSRMGYGEDSVIVMQGMTVFYSTLPDSEKVADIWKSVYRSLR